MPRVNTIVATRISVSNSTYYRGPEAPVATVNTIASN